MRRVVEPGAVGATLVLVALLVGACAGGTGGSADGPRPGRCGPDVEEPLDPRSTQHLLPGAPEPAYASDAPTSGPHRLGSNPSGVQPAPLPRPDQVALLEQGHVLVQHRLPPGPARRRLEALAGEGVVVAPLDGPGPAVVATAWRHRLTCSGVDVDALQSFVAAHRGKVGA